MRKVGLSRKIISATPRQIESLIRISEARAKMRLSQSVTKEDVLFAFDLIRSAMNQSAIDPASGLIDMNLLSTGYSSVSKERVKGISTILDKLI